MPNLRRPPSPVSRGADRPSVAYCLISHAPDHAIGGMEVHMMELARAVRGAGWAVSGITPDLPSLSAMARFFTQHGMPSYRAAPLGTTGAPQLLRDWARLVARLRAIRPDVLHIHRALPRFGKWTIAAARAAAVPLIVTTDHDLPAGTEMARGWGDRLADRLLGAVIVASEYNRRAQVAQLGRPERLVHRIYCGIDLARFPLRDGPGMAAARAALGLPADALVIGSVARLVETKRIADLLAAAARLAAGPYPQLHVLIAGEGPLRPQLEAQAAALGLAAVRFLGYHPDSAEAMRAMDVFVLPSSWEGFGLVAAEAMATGAPVVATQAGGLAEVVADGAGLLVPVGDLDALTAAIARCLGDPGLRQELSAIGRRRVEEHFSAEAMARGVTDIYGRLLGRRAER